MKIYLQRVRINSGGYDCSGTYWGTGQPLYHFFDDGDISDYVRAYNREDAKERISAWVKVNYLVEATFYR